MNRKDVKTEYKWSLEDIFATDELFAAAENEFKKSAGLIGAYAGKLSDRNELLECLKKSDELDLKAERLYVYCNMRRDENAATEKYVDMCDRMDGLMAKYQTECAFIAPELSAQSDEYLDSLIADPEFSDFDEFLKEIRRKKAHILGEKEEKILAQTSPAMGSFREIFGKIDYIDLALPKIKDENGKRIQLTQGKYSACLNSQDAGVRKRAFAGLYKAYESLINTITATYAGSVKADNFYAAARGYDSALSKAMSGENVPESVYKNLISAVEKNVPVLHRYVALRKKILGLEKMHMYDMYVPLTADATEKYDFETAFTTVCDALSPLGSEYASLLARAKSERWMDVYETENKRNGAYSWGCYGTHPFVLLNHEGTLHDVFTIAHELGHAMHSHYSNSVQPHAKAGYAIFVAEVASTVNEVLTLKRLLSKATDAETRKYLLGYYLDTFRTTLFRQTMFAQFELIAHERAQDGKALTPKSLSDEYYKLNKKYYGAAVTHDKAIRLEWARIPHFYTAFYVYKYATGITAAVNIARDILSGGDDALARYKRFLSAGGSDSPYEILKAAGVDLATEKPFETAMAEFAETLDALEKETEK